MNAEDHQIESGTIPDPRNGGVASASCPCGWAAVQDYARNTGRAVAERLVRFKGRQHLFDVDNGVRSEEQ